MATTVSEQCVCGGAFTAATRQHGKAVTLHAVWTAKHSDCITASRNEDEDHPEGDVYASAERAGQHSQHELQTGFQRGDLSW